MKEDFDAVKDFVGDTRRYAEYRLARSRAGKVVDDAGERAGQEAH
jgi:hypothetical protein